jgi:hypothetical protein
MNTVTVTVTGASRVYKRAHDSVRELPYAWGQTCRYIDRHNIVDLFGRLSRIDLGCKALDLHEIDCHFWTSVTRFTSTLGGLFGFR